MARMKKSSRHLVLLVAFIGVMAVTGGLLGAIGGVVLALLTHALLSLQGALAYLLVTSAGLGALSGGAYGVLLFVRTSGSSVKVRHLVGQTVPIPVDAR